MHHNLNAQTNKSLATLKLFTADVCLPKTSWKTVPQPWADSCKTSVPKVAVGSPDDTSLTESAERR